MSNDKGFNRDFRKIAEERILVFDGAMGTQIENYLNDYDITFNSGCATCINLNGKNNYNKKIDKNLKIKSIINFDSEYKKSYDNNYNNEDTGDFNKKSIIKENIKCNEHINLISPWIIEEIHGKYIKSRADIIETNTFGAQKLVLKEYGLEKNTYEINKKAVEIAKTSIKKYSKNKKVFISGSIGPGKKLPSLNQITYNELFDSYVPQIEGLVDGGVDILQIETSQDILQAKIAYQVIKYILNKKRIDIPIFVQLTFEKSGKMLLGTDVDAVVSAFLDLDIYALGVNCGVGPAELYDVLRIFRNKSPFKLVIIPNAGLPEIKDGKVYYNMEPEIFSNIMIDLVKKFSPEFVGGCCGTEYEHIKLLKEKLENNGLINYYKENKKNVNKVKYESCFSSLYQSQKIDVELKPLIIGERVNAIGSKKVKEALLNNDFNSIVEVALNQEKEGAHLIDLNLAYSSRNEIDDIKKILPDIIKFVKIPLCIDTTSIDVIEYVLKNYPGKCLVNSMSFENFEKGAKILKLVKKYGAGVICLTIDEKGLGFEIERKIKIAKRIYDYAVKKIGLRPQQLIFDPLTFSIAVADDKGRNLILNTLESIPEIKKQCKGSFVSLGISNVSYGLPQNLRKYINSVVLKYAIDRGLDIAIISAKKIVSINNIEKNILEMIEEIIFNLVKRKDLINKLIEKFDKKGKEKNEFLEIDTKQKLKQFIINGKKEGIENLVEKCIEDNSARKTLDILLDSMKIVGNLFEEGKIYLPFVLRSAEVMKKAIKILKPYLSESVGGIENKSRILLATVKGDIHDIGKNLVGIILENNGIEIIDLGVNVNNNKLLNTIKENSINNIDFIGLSGLLVKSAFAMKDTLLFLNENNIKIPVIVGGAALTKSYVENELNPIYNGKVFYAKDAFSALTIIRDTKNNKKKKINNYNTGLINNEITNNKIMENKKSNNKKINSKKLNNKRINRINNIMINNELIKNNIMNNEIENNRVIKDIMINNEMKINKKNYKNNNNQKFKIKDISEKDDIKLIKRNIKNYINDKEYKTNNKEKLIKYSQNMVEFKIDELVKYLNKNVLFYQRWELKKYRNLNQMGAYLEKYIKMISDFKFKGVFGIFNVKKYKSGVLILGDYDENTDKKSKYNNKKSKYNKIENNKTNTGIRKLNTNISNDIERYVFLDFGRRKNIKPSSLADYMYDEIDILSLYAVTVGYEIDQFLKNFHKKSKYFDYFMLYGLLAEIVDGAADRIQEIIENIVYKEEKNIVETKKNKIKNEMKVEKFKAKRYSFGYPSCPDLEQQKKLIDILDAQKIGITYTETGMLNPELSTAGFLIFNPEAQYININEN